MVEVRRGTEQGSSTGSLNGNGRITKYRRLRPFKLEEVKVLLLENISPVAINLLKDAGYQVEVCSQSLPKEELREKLKTVHALGIRYWRAVTWSRWLV